MWGLCGTGGVYGMRGGCGVRPTPKRSQSPLSPSRHRANGVEQDNIYWGGEGHPTAGSGGHPSASGGTQHPAPPGRGGSTPGNRSGCSARGVRAPRVCGRVCVSGGSSGGVGGGQHSAGVGAHPWVLQDLFQGEALVRAVL